MLNVVEHVDHDEADDHEEHPGADFVKGNDVPVDFLARIQPGTRVGADVFADPDKESNESKRYHKRHAAQFRVNAVVHPGSAVQNHDGCK